MEKMTWILGLLVKAQGFNKSLGSGSQRVGFIVLLCIVQSGYVRLPAAIDSSQIRTAPTMSGGGLRAHVLQ